MGFHIGQQVVCIVDFDEWIPREWANCVTTLPQKGSVYTVRSVAPGEGMWGESGLYFIRLNEIVNPVGPFPREPAFESEAFRPVEEKKLSTETGMTILRGLLVPSKETVDA